MILVFLLFTLYLSLLSEQQYYVKKQCIHFNFKMFYC